jgi:serine/threonine protein kinase
LPHCHGKFVVFGSKSSYVSPSPSQYPTHVLTILKQALGLAELYNRDIVHCDLKPGNILVSPGGHLAIADFGISMMPDVILDAGKPLEECEFFSYGGTYAYQAPELLISHHGASFTCAVDMWSFGVIIFEIYTGRVRFACYLLAASQMLKHPPSCI